MLYILANFNNEAHISCQGLLKASRALDGYPVLSLVCKWIQVLLRNNIRNFGILLVRNITDHETCILCAQTFNA